MSSSSALVVAAPAAAAAPPPSSPSSQALTTTPPPTANFGKRLRCMTVSTVSENRMIGGTTTVAGASGALSRQHAHTSKSKNLNDKPKLSSADMKVMVTKSIIYKGTQFGDGHKIYTKLTKIARQAQSSNKEKLGDVDKELVLPGSAWIVWKKEQLRDPIIENVHYVICYLDKEAREQFKLAKNSKLPSAGMITPYACMATSNLSKYAREHHLEYCCPKYTPSYSPNNFNYQKPEPSKDPFAPTLIGDALRERVMTALQQNAVADIVAALCYTYSKCLAPKVIPLSGNIDMKHPDKKPDQADIIKNSIISLQSLEWTHSIDLGNIVRNSDEENSIKEFGYNAYFKVDSYKFERLVPPKAFYIMRMDSNDFATYLLPVDLIYRNEELAKRIELDGKDKKQILRMTLPFFPSSFVDDLVNEPSVLFLNFALGDNPSAQSKWWSTSDDNGKVPKIKSHAPVEGYQWTRPIVIPITKESDPLGKEFEEGVEKSRVYFNRPQKIRIDLTIWSDSLKNFGLNENDVPAWKEIGPLALPASVMLADVKTDLLASEGVLSNASKIDMPLTETEKAFIETRSKYDADSGENYLVVTKAELPKAMGIAFAVPTCIGYNCTAEDLCLDYVEAIKNIGMPVSYAVAHVLLARDGRPICLDPPELNNGGVVNLSVKNPPVSITEASHLFYAVCPVLKPEQLPLVTTLKVDVTNQLFSPEFAALSLKKQLDYFEERKLNEGLAKIIDMFKGSNFYLFAVPKNSNIDKEVEEILSYFPKAQAAIRGASNPKVEEMKTDDDHGVQSTPRPTINDLEDEDQSKKRKRDSEFPDIDAEVAAPPAKQKKGEFDDDFDMNALDDYDGMDN